MCRACSSTVEITRSGATLPRDPPPPVAPIGALGRFHVLPGHQRQQRHRGRGRLVELGHRSNAASTAFASSTSAETSASLARPGRSSRSAAYPAGCSRARCTPPRSPRRPRAPAGPPAGSREISWVMVSWVATASSRIVESTARRRRPASTPVASITCRTASLIRCGRSDFADPLTPVHQARRVEPLIQQRQPARHLPPQIAPDRLGALPVRQLVQRLQRQHRGHPGRRQRRATDRGEQIRVLLVGEHIGRGARPGTRTCCPPRPDDRPPARRPTAPGSGPSTPCTRRSSQTVTAPASATPTARPAFSAPS